MRNHLLIIDDHDADLLYARLVVERAGTAHRVSALESAREALAFLQQADGADVALILLDINMPGLDGFGFLQAFEKLFAGQPRPAPVVVMLTSSPDPHDRERAFSFASVRDYVVKPISVEGMRQLAVRLDTPFARG